VAHANDGGVASDAGSDSRSGGEGTCVAVRAKHRAKDRKEGDEEEDAWRVRALRRGTDVLSRRQQRKRHVVLRSWAFGPHFSFLFLTDMYLYDHMTSTHMTARLYNRAIS